MENPSAQPPVTPESPTNQSTPIPPPPPPPPSSSPSPISSLEQIDPPPVSEKKKPKKFISVIFFILTIALGATGGVFGYQYVQRQKLFQAQPSPEPTVQQPSPSPDPTEGWKTYENQLGFSLKYPQDVKLENSLRLSEDEIIFSVQSTPIDKIIDFTFNYTKATALSDKASLEKGIFGIHLQGLKESEEVVKISDNIYVKIFTILQELEVCNVQFIRKAIFYYKDSQIILAFSAPRKKVVLENKEYFSTDEANCGSIDIWPIGDNTPQKFYQALKDNKTSGLSQYWFNTFDQILSTFKFTTSQPSETSLDINLIKQACIELQGTTKAWDEEHLECIEGGVAKEKLIDFCKIYKGKFIDNADSCRYAEEGTSCGPVATYYCNFN